MDKTNTTTDASGEARPSLLEAAKVLLEAWERAQIDSAIMRKFYDGRAKAGLFALIENLSTKDALPPAPETELSLAEKLVSAKRFGASEAADYYFEMMAEGVRRSGKLSMGVGGWDDIRDFFDIKVKPASARIEALLEALKPFADIADAYDPPEGDDDHPLWDQARMPTLGMVRAARRIYGEHRR